MSIGKMEDKIKQFEKMFRFQDFVIWQRAADLSMPLFKLADQLDKSRKYRFAEQLRSAVLSITNNIAEGSGSDRKNDFRSFLRYARRSMFEVANILILMTRSGYIKDSNVKDYLNELFELSKMTTAFMSSL